MSCDELGQCYCKGNFDNLQCSVCRESFYNYPICEECNCDPNGVIQSFAGNLMVIFSNKALRLKDF